MQWPWQLHWDLRRWEGNADDADDLVRIRKGKTGWKKAVSASERTDGGRGTVVGNCPKIQPASCRASSSSYPTPIPVSGFFLQVVFAHIGSQYFSLGKSYCLKIQPASCRSAAHYQLQFPDLALSQVVFAAIRCIVFLIGYVIAQRCNLPHYHCTQSSLSTCSYIC